MIFYLYSREISRGITMRDLRSKKTIEGREMAGARALWIATGTKPEEFGRPVIAICNSFTEFVPGHVHLRDVGKIVAESIRKAGGIPKEMNTIAVDDGIAMGHDGMLYSLPSRDLIADSVEYMANAHRADALVCISNCDKVTPGMLMASMRLNIPAVFVSGGPMEAGHVKQKDGSDRALDLIDAMIDSADTSVSDEETAAIEAAACPTCGSCSGMFTANSMNSLTEAIGLSLPGNGSIVATNAERRKLFEEAGRRVVELCHRYYDEDDDSILPRSIATKEAFENAMRLDIAMGGSSNTVLHLLAVAQEAGADFTMKDIDRLSRNTPCICKVAPTVHNIHVEDVNRAGGIFGILAELDRMGLIHRECHTVHAKTMGEAIDTNDVMKNPPEEIKQRYLAGPGRKFNITAFSQDSHYDSLDLDRANGAIRDAAHAYSKDGGLAVLYGNLAVDGCIVKTAGVDESILKFTGPAVVFESQEDAVKGILDPNRVKAGDVVVIRYEGPKGGPGMQEMLYPTSYLKSRHLGKLCALLTDGRFSGGTSGLSIGHASPEAASKGNIGLVQDGDIIEIDIPNRTINVGLTDAELAERRKEMEARGTKAWKPVSRDRKVSKALQAYGIMASSADKGAVRDINNIL